MKYKLSKSIILIILTICICIAFSACTETNTKNTNSTEQNTVAETNNVNNIDENETTDDPVYDNIGLDTGGNVYSGGHTTSIIDNEGNLFICGSSSAGQVGDTIEDFITQHKLVFSNVKAVCGSSSFAAITNKNHLYTWGYNSYNQLGYGMCDDSPTPTQIEKNIIDVSITGSTCAYVNKKCEMYVMGYPRVSFGDKDNTRESSTPVKIMDNVIDVELSTNNDYGQTFAAITKNNELYMWGDNSHGIINPNTEEPIDKPTKVMDNVKSVSIGDSYVLAVTTSNELYAWGYNRFGKLGIGNTETPSEKVKVMDNVLLADAGTNTSLAVNLNGELFTWGHNSYGCLGQGIDFEEDDNDVLLPTKIMSNVKSASLDESTMIILDKNGDVYTCGWNTRGQLGTGDTDDRNVPTLIYNIYNSATTENE